MHKAKKKLHLRTETIRLLQPQALAQAAGGIAGPTAPTADPNPDTGVNPRTLLRDHANRPTPLRDRHDASITRPAGLGPTDRPAAYAGIDQ